MPVGRRLESLPMSDRQGISVREAKSSDAAAILYLRNRIVSETSFMLLDTGEFQDSVEDEAKRIDRLNSRDNCLLKVSVPLFLQSPIHLAD